MFTILVLQIKMSLRIVKVSFGVFFAMLCTTITTLTQPSVQIKMLLYALVAGLMSMHVLNAKS